MFARLWSGVSRTALSTLLVAVALVVATLFVYVGTLTLPADRGDFVLLVVAFVTLGELGFVAAAGVFLFASGDEREYVRVALPDGRDWRYVVGGTVVTYVLAATATLASQASNGGGVLPTSELGAGREFGSVGEFEAAYGLAPGSVETTLLALVVLSLLVIGPSEELLFRGVVQRYLSGAFPRAGAVGVASVLFTAVHVPTLLLPTSGLTSAIAAATIFAISVTLGYAYALTDNLVVPTIVHGVYDATLFGVAYVALRMGLL